MRTLFLLRGAPASGKSTWIKDNNLESYTLSADNIRLMCESPKMNIDGTKEITQRNDHYVWDLLMELLERRMSNGDFIIIDATHYKASLINKYDDLVDKYRYRVYVVDFSDVSEEELLKRNSERDFKRVPDETISKMVVALKKTNEIKKSYKIISPNEALQIINNPIEPVVVDKDKVVVFGDIHGCYEPLKEYFDKNPFDENTCYIFCGDYLDRGIQNKEVLEFLLKIYDEKNVILLEGNHEKWLRVYSDKEYNIEDFLDKEEKEYKDLYITKLISILKIKMFKTKNDIDYINNEITKIKEELEQERKINKETDSIYYDFRLINVSEEIKKKELEKDKLSYSILKLEALIQKLKDAEIKNGKVFDEINEKYNILFGEYPYIDIKQVFIKYYDIKTENIENSIHSKEFMNYTYDQIKDIDKTELRKLCRKFSQMSYFSFNGKKYLVTHGGVPVLPNVTMPANELIKGVGNYGDVRFCDDSFVDYCVKNSLDIISIHGHRNVYSDPTKMNAGRVYNLEGKVEFGGNLRILEIDKSGEHVVEIKNNIYKVEKEVENENIADNKKSDIDVLRDMIHSNLIEVKNLKNYVISLNFTRTAFNNKKWNELTCTARGLFVNKKNGDVVARSFSKFFNYNEVEATRDEELQKNLCFPVVAYEKENGFLAIISKYKGNVYIFTKSTDSGDFVNYFKNILYNIYNVDNENDLKDKLSPLLIDGYSYIFECIDPINDPHIIKYDKPDIYLLLVMKNQLTEEHIAYDDLVNISKKLGIKVKSKYKVFESFEEFYNFKEEFFQDNLSNKREGYVFEDKNGFRLKLKSNYYSFWKRMRTVKEHIQKGAGNKKIYESKSEIEIVKILESIDKEKLKEMSIIDIEDLYYNKAGTNNV